MDAGCSKQGKPGHAQPGFRETEESIQKPIMLENLFALLEIGEGGKRSKVPVWFPVPSALDTVSPCPLLLPGLPGASCWLPSLIFSSEEHPQHPLGFFGHFGGRLMWRGFSWWKRRGDRSG